MNKNFAKGLANDALFVVGCASVTYGLGQIFEPLYWVFPGVIALAVGLLRSRAGVQDSDS